MAHLQEEDFWRTLELLPRVLTLIASTDHEITDDTCLEKLMSWFQSSFRDKVKLCHLLNSSTLQFLSSASAPDKDCSSSCLNFALKILPSLVTSMVKHSQDKGLIKITSTAVDPVISDVCKVDTESDNCVQSMAVLHQLQDSHISTNGGIMNTETGVMDAQTVSSFHRDLVKIGSGLLKKCLKRDYWEDVSIRNTWILAVTDLMTESEWIPVLDEVGAFSKSMELLKDQSMFVVGAAQLFLAKIILLSDVGTEVDGMDLQQNSHCNRDVPDSPSKTGDINGQLLAKDADKSCQPKVEMMSLEIGNGPISHIPSSKRKLHEADSSFGGDIPSKVTKHSAQETVSSLDQSKWEDSRNRVESASTLSKWKTNVMQLILQSGETLSSKKDITLSPGLLSCQDHSVASSLGVLPHLLRTSPEVGVKLIAKHSLIQQNCSVLQQKNAKSILAEAVVKMFCLFLEKSTELLALPEDTLWSQIDSIMDVVIQQLVKTRQLKQYCQLIPALFGLCNKVDQSRCLPDRIKSKLKKFTSILMMSLTVCLEDVNQSGFKENQGFPLEVTPFFQGATKQDLYTVKYYSLVCLEKLILEGSLNSSVGCTELLEPLHVLLRWISCQHVTFSKQKVDKFLKQYLDVVKELQGEGTEPSLLLPIMHSVLELINSSDCDNTVLNKSLHLLKFHILHGQQEGHLDLNQQLMGKARHVLEKHLLSLRWESRDSAINFIGSLLEISDGVITSWFMETKIHHHIWDRLEDDESYVREASLNALGKLSQNCSLLNDFMEKYNLQDTDILKKVRAILRRDPGGFARRAAIGLLCGWLKDDSWMRSSLLLSPQWKSDEIGALDENCSSIPEMVFCSVITASRDLDWEVKLSSLEFWGEFLQAMIPGFVLPDVSLNSNTPNSYQCKQSDEKSQTMVMENFESEKRKEKLAISDLVKERDLSTCEGNIPQYAAVFEDLRIPVEDCDTNVEGSTAKTISCERTKELGNTNLSDIASRVSWIEILDGHICLQMLFEKLGDEDRTVCSRACEILLSLKDHLTKVCDGYGRSEIKSKPVDDKCRLKDILSLIAEHKVYEVQNGCLEGSHEKMSALLEEILSAANVSSEKKIDIDCY